MKNSRVEKFKIYRSEIEHMTPDSPLLQKSQNNIPDFEYPQKKKENGVTKTTLDISMEELLDAHAKYVGKDEEEKQKRLEQKRKTLRLYGYLGIFLLLIGVLILVLVAVFQTE